MNSKSDAVNYGSIYENVVAQELLAHGFSELYYYNSKKMGALNNILDCSEYNIPESVVLCNDNYTQKDKVTYAPIYMVMFIHKDPVIDVKFSLDLSGLIKSADWLIELGPYGGGSGGELLYSGVPSGVMSEPRSVTRRYLAEVL